MTLRFPLYAKILFWFFLNLLLLALAFYVVFQIQFRPGLDSLLAGRAGERIQLISDIIEEELADTARENWDDVLKRFGRSSKVQFYLFRPDGAKLAGEPVVLPPAVAAELNRGGPPPHRMQPPEREPAPGDARPRPRPEDGPPPPRDRSPNDPTAPRPAPFKFMRRAGEPPLYWVGVRVTLPASGRSRGQPAPAVLLASSESLRGGGLFFDPTPWVVVGFGAFFFSVLFWIPLVHGITRSISQMTRATEQIAEGHFDARAPTRRSDELGRLGAAINHLAARLTGFVTGQKRFLGDTAHELCSPLARMQMALGILEQRADEKQRGYVNDVREEVQQMSSLVNELLSFSKASLGPATIQLQPVPVRAVMEEVVRRESVPGAEIHMEAAEGLSALAEPELLKRALANLLRNALRHAGSSGPITLSATGEGQRVILQVSDRGPGVPEESLAQLFDPFYRVDQARTRESGGVGLGLTIVKSCVEACRGTVTCRNLQPAGFQVEMVLQAAGPN